MKSYILSLLIASVAPAFATITLNTQFGVAYNSLGVAVPDGTAWIMVVDANNDSSFAGGFGLEGTLANANSTFSTGQVITNNSVLGSDFVFAMGSFNGTGSGLTGASLDAVTFELNSAAGLVANRAFAFYWFPGATIVNGQIVVAGEVGGIHSAVDAANVGAMTIPNDGATLPSGAATSGDAGGSLPNSRFTAVQLIPEPSTMLLGAFGALGLLRRRR